MSIAIRKFVPESQRVEIRDLESDICDLERAPCSPVRLEAELSRGIEPRRPW